MSYKKPVKKVALGALLTTLLLYPVCLSSVVHSADEPVTEINSWGELWDIAKDPAITNMKLNIDVESPNTCSVPWIVSTASRVLDLNGHTITSTDTGGSSGSCAMDISYDTGWNDYSFTVKNGKLAQNFTKMASSSLMHVHGVTCTVSNYNLVLQDVDMEMSPTTRVGSAIYFERAANTAHSRKLEVDGGEYNIVGMGAISFSSYLSSNGNTEYSSNDKVVLKKMRIKNIASGGYTAIFNSNINQPLSSTICKDSKLYDGDTLVTDLTSMNYSSKNTLTIGLERVALSDLAVSLASWTYGETPNTPKVTGNLGTGAETFLYRARGSEDWSLDVPTAVGEYELKLNVAQTENYLAGEAMTEFSIKPAKLPEDGEEDFSKEDENPGTSDATDVSDTLNSSDTTKSPDTLDAPNSPDTGHLAKEIGQDSLIQFSAGTYLFVGIVAAAVLLCKKQDNRHIRQH